MNKKTLGKGLGALLGQDIGISGERVSRIRIDLIVTGQYQPRKSFDENSISHLAESIKAGGILQPLIVRRKDNVYELISGERRLRAAIEAGMTTVPVIIKEMDDQLVVIMSLVENIQREDLNPIEESNALKKLVDEFHLSHQQIGLSVGKSRTHISNMLRLQKLPSSVIKLLVEGLLTFGHGKVLVNAGDDKVIEKLAVKCSEENLSVRELEALISESSEKKEPVPRRTPAKLSPHFRKIEKNMTTVLGVPVKIRKGRRKGKIEIEFSNTEQLDHLIGILFGNNGEA
jgi:ParB family chromosome partitioning protein